MSFADICELVVILFIILWRLIL